MTIPHSGENIPVETPWLSNLPEEIIMCDVDRFVDLLYEPTLTKLNIPWVKSSWHRYAVDLNRIPEDIDQESVSGSVHPPGSYPRGFHWVTTTLGFRLQTQPMSQETHQLLVSKIFEPFHSEIKNLCQNKNNIYHLDVHSMPSRGTSMHRDPGEERADIVISDCEGKSSSSSFRDLVIASYVVAGFKVAYNWPYKGGRVTEQYGQPKYGHHALQVELNRSLYMDETTKQIRRDLFKAVQIKIEKALSYISTNLKFL